MGAGRGRCRTSEIGLVAGAEGMASFLASLPWKMDVEDFELIHRT